uniref:CHRD domain-containing protein n=1 Tax=Timspurckia oligopyrenoides TaxID=708627 RepID=A0A7S0ZFB0_9RHOD|mmetsp:Transcript_3081/g.5430  ORF Transcript_3081/g.5430 Transcript_3081/m.5430 type:complete len:251 (+) Transcript_3081:210-962(+)
MSSKLCIVFAFALLAVGVFAQERTCPCSFVNEFPDCVYPAPTEGTCFTESCAGWICSPEASSTTTCRVTSSPSYAITGPNGQCAPAVSTLVVPEWSGSLEGGFFCGSGCNGEAELAVSDVSVSTPEQIGSSNAYLYINIFPNTVIAAAFSFSMENTAACEGAENTLTAFHVHRKSDGSNTGPVAWTICGGGGTPCPSGLAGFSGTYILVYNGNAALAPIELSAIQNNPSGYYVNLHTPCAPSGLIRGEFA